MSDPATAAARAALDALPRAGLVPAPTPLVHLPRFSAVIGAEVWCKRDDVGGPGLAGNKARKFDLLFGQALADGCDTVVTTGALQSNSARTAAAAAASAGMACVLVLRGHEPAAWAANALLDRLFGAEVRFAGDVGWGELDALVDGAAGEARAAGRRPFTAPVGASSPLGALGFAAAHLELTAQCEAAGIAPAAAYHASTSGGTHAGLLVGLALAGGGPRPHAVAAGALSADPAAAVAGLAARAAALVGLDPGRLPDPSLDVAHIGDAYGVPTGAAAEAIALLARTEGIVCDPVYSGKALAGLVADARAGRVGRPVVFWHTGGWHVLFDPAYGDGQLALTPAPTPPWVPR